jgi:hypothetical protein
MKAIDSGFASFRIPSIINARKEHKMPKMARASRLRIDPESSKEPSDPTQNPGEGCGVFRRQGIFTWVCGV